MPESDPRLEAWKAFLRAHARVMTQLEHELVTERELPLAWYDVLVTLSAAPGHRLRMHELAARVMLSRSGVSRLIDRMEAAGLLEREVCEHDRRGWFASLSAKGNEVLRDAAPVHLRGVAQHFSDLLTPEEAEVLRRALERVAEAAAGAGRRASV